MKKRRQIEMFSISFLDLLSGALGAVIILYVAIPKNKPTEAPPKDIEKVVLQRQLDEAQSALQMSKDKVKELEAKLAAAATPVPIEAPPAEIPVPTSDGEGDGLSYDVGFKFKGRNIVFIVDTSYSMVEEDRMGQVKAGLKMLLTSLPANYKIEFVQYPLGERAPFKSLWGTVKESTKFNKLDAFDFIYRLKPSGGTPTRDALLFALRNYEAMTDLVLLTDGVPTYHNSNTKDDIYDILKAVREVNGRKVQINTIGVGTDFLSDKTSPQYKFLSLLAEETGGFFVGF